MFGFIRDARKERPAGRPPSDFLPGSLRLLEQPPSPLPRRLLYWLMALLVLAALWLAFGRLDIVAVADGKLAPRTSLKIVQPTDPGTLLEILVTEGETVLSQVAPSSILHFAEQPSPSALPPSSQDSPDV